MDARRRIHARPYVDDLGAARALARNFIPYLYGLFFDFLPFRIAGRELRLDHVEVVEQGLHIGSDLLLFISRQKTQVLVCQGLQGDTGEGGRDLLLLRRSGA